MSTMVSIIIVNWNTRAILLDCLQSIYQQTSLPFEVIVVDNHSHDNSAEAVGSSYPQAKVIRNAENLGFAKANNIGWKAADGKYVIFLNSDTIILDQAIDKMVNFMELNPGVGVLGPHTLNADGKTTQNTVIFIPRLAGVFHTHLPFWRFIPGWRPRLAGEVSWQKTGPVEIVKGSCLVVSKDLVLKLGGMTEKHFMYSEEYDLCTRAAELGYPTWFYDGATIIHLGGQSTAQNNLEMVVMMIKAYTDIFKKHNPGSSVALFHLFLFLGSLWRILAWIPFLAGSNKKHAYQRILEHQATLLYLSGLL